MKAVLCNALCSCAKTLNWNLGIQIHASMIRSGYEEMRRKNLTPSDHTLSSILNACGSLTALLQGRQLHSLIIKIGSESNVFVASALIDMYSKSGDIDEARFVLDQTSGKNAVLWTSMIMGYAQCGRSSEALVLFDSLLTEKRFIPDHVCFTAVLTACNHAGLLDKGVEYFNQMRTNYGLSPSLDHYACLIDLYARNGNLRKAKALMEEMPYEPNHVIWSSILSSCKIHGEVELGREAADRLIKMEPCNAAPYITLAHLYARNGLWAEASEVRSLMKQRRLRKHAGWSWILVD
ncbi:pentatricopeptide repeat-containing protein At2g37320-like [Prosopis cineraria]|uniref:pentatricopeptide repeat-containing protein At2g37320-like n=1 Tax=Prosopis cineraria TaxID=364024 RepID=UPI00240FF368|nr:pentatricopeptide repeat-containing protein At2g37320-like [Prosopis cineraria]